MPYVGTAGDDFPDVNSSSDLRYYGLDGNDRLTSSQTHAIMYGDFGNDTLYYTGPGYLDGYGGEGNDWIIGSYSTVSCYMFGDTGNDVLYGGIASDFLDGGLGQIALSEERETTLFTAVTEATGSFK